MRQLLIAAVIFLACGIKPPFPPLGCKGDWVCICSSGNDCDWVFVCQE